MPEYRVREGCRHGAGRQYGSGAVVELTESEAASFLDKLELVEETESDAAPIGDAHIRRVLGGSVSDVMRYVETGGMATAGENVEELLAAERAGAGRVTLIRQLEALIDGSES